MVCNNILRREGYADDVYFSATNVLYQKLKKQFVCLPAGSHEGLKDSLMVALKGFCLRLPQLWKVVSKLSAAVAVLALQMDSWTDPIGSVVQTFGQDAAGARCALFAIMSMPAEAKSATVRVGRLRRAAFTQYLQASLPAVFGFVQTLLAACGGESESEGNGDGKKNTGLASLAFHCLHEWLAAGDVPLDLILRSPLTPAMFVAMRDSTLVRDAANCICSLTSIAKRALRAKQNCDALRTFLVDQTVKLAPL